MYTWHQLYIITFIFTLHRLHNDRTVMFGRISEEFDNILTKFSFIFVLISIFTTRTDEEGWYWKDLSIGYDHWRNPPPFLMQQSIKRISLTSFSQPTNIEVTTRVPDATGHQANFLELSLTTCNQWKNHLRSWCNNFCDLFLRTCPDKCIFEVFHRALTGVKFGKGIPW